MSGIIKHSLGIIRTLLVWAIVGAAGIIIYQHYTTKENMPGKSEAVNGVKRIKEKAAVITNKLNKKLPAIKDKLSKTGKIIIDKVSPEEENAGIKELLDASQEPEKANEVESNRNAPSTEQQDIFKRQVAIVNDLMQ